MASLSSAQLADLVRRHWPQGVVPQTGLSIRATAFAVCRAESGGKPQAIGDKGNSIGLWQVNRPAHPQYPRSRLLEPEYNAAAASAISSTGLNWNDWCTFERTACGGRGRASYRAYLAEAQAALATPAPPSPPPGPTPQAGNRLGAVLLLLVGGAGLLAWAVLPGKGRERAPVPLLAPQLRAEKGKRSSTMPERSGIPPLLVPR